MHSLCGTSRATGHKNAQFPPRPSASISTPSTGKRREAGLRNVDPNAKETDIMIDPTFSAPTALRRWLRHATVCVLLLGTAGFATAQEASAPAFVTEPQSQTSPAGGSAQFSATVTGLPTPSLQWFFNGLPLPGKTNTALSLPNVQASHAGFYWLTASNASGQLSSRPAQLTVTPSAPQIPRAPIILHPQGKTQPFQPGQRLELQCSVFGTEPMSLQWLHDGFPISGATHPNLEIPGITYADAGAYSIVASNAHGVVYGPKLTVSVSSLVVVGVGGQVPTNLPPQLGDVKALAVGHYHVLAIDPAGKVFAWNNGPNGATNVPANLGPAKAVASSAFNSMALLESGRVAAWAPGPLANPIFTNVPTSVTSIVAIANADNGGLAVRSNGTVVSWGSSEANRVPQGLSNVVSIAASGLHASALQNNGRIVAWGPANYTSVPASLNDAIALSATSARTLALRENGTVVAWGVAVPPVPPQATNIVAISAGDMLNLALRADGRLILWGSASNQLAGRTAQLSNVTAIAASHRSSFYAAVVGDGSPRITLHPHGQELPNGSSIRLHARAVGQQPMAYQWQRNGQPVPGATSPTLVLDRQAGSLPGRYRLVASNELGSMVSDEASVTVRHAGTLGQALNAPQLNWQGFNAVVQGIVTTNAWIPQNEESFDGEGSARSGPVDHGKGVALRTTVFGPGQLSFRWKVSSEEGYDWLAFTNITRTGQASPGSGRRISGETGWELVTVDLPPGGNQLSWFYTKDGTVSAGRDGGWVDTVTLVPAPPAITRYPTGIRTFPGRIEGMSVEVSSMVQHVVTWFFNDIPILGTSGYSHFIQASSTPSTNTFRVVVSNSAGETGTTNLPFIVWPTPRLSGPTRSPEGFRFQLAWPHGATMTEQERFRFFLQTSTNLVDWTGLDGGAGFPTNGILDFIDRSEPASPMRFYRLTP